MDYLIYIFFALAPSVIWLLFFLGKDSHPESKRMILRIFFWGMLAGIPAILLEVGIFKIIGQLNFSPLLILALYMFIGVALVEELLKYLVVKGEVLKNSEFDEPTDAIIYMITAAMGFAAIENLLFLWQVEKSLTFSTYFLNALALSSFRFLGATFLHALTSGIIGYFLALSLFKTKRRFQLLTIGFLTAVSLHGLYNFSIISIEGGWFEKLIIPAIILIGSASFLFLGFRKVKKMASVCKIK